MSNAFLQEFTQSSSFLPTSGVAVASESSSDSSKNSPHLLNSFGLFGGQGTNSTSNGTNSLSVNMNLEPNSMDANLDSGNMNIAAVLPNSNSQAVQQRQMTTTFASSGSNDVDLGSRRSLGDVRRNIDRILYNLPGVDDGSAVGGVMCHDEDSSARCRPDQQQQQQQPVSSPFSNTDRSGTDRILRDQQAMLRRWQSEHPLSSAAAAVSEMPSTVRSSTSLQQPRVSSFLGGTTDHLEIEPVPIDASRVKIVPKLETADIFQDQSLMEFFRLVRCKKHGRVDGCFSSNADSSGSNNNDNDNLGGLLDNTSSMLTNWQYQQQPPSKRRKADVQSGLDGIHSIPLAQQLQGSSMMQQQQTQQQQQPSSFFSALEFPQFQQLSNPPLFTSASAPSASENIAESTSQKKQQQQQQQSSADASSGSTKIRSYQELQWEERYKELCEYRDEFGHCCVPYGYPKNRVLAQWVKRQRYQLRLRLDGKHSTMTVQRQQKLDKIGFCWDSHKAQWEERFQELVQFKAKNGHCLIPVRYAANPQLAIWVKCQRRQYKLLHEGKTSNITQERIDRLNGLGFVWSPRGTI